MADHNPNRRPSPLELERYLLGELPAERMEAIRQLEAADADLGEQLRSMRADTEALFIKLPPKRAAVEIEKRAGVGPAVRKRGSWLTWAAPLVATAVVMFVALPPRKAVCRQWRVRRGSLFGRAIDSAWSTPC